MDWLALENFRAFGERSVATIAPITLVYGPNSAGKSSLVKSLLLLKQSALESPGGGFRYDGPFVDLGGPRAVAHRHSVSKRISVEIDLGVVQVESKRWTVALGFAMGVERAEDDRVSVTARTGDFEAHIEFRRAGRALDLFRVSDNNSASEFAALLDQLNDSDRLFEVGDRDSIRGLAFQQEAMLPGSVVGRFQSATANRLASDIDGSDGQLWNSLSSRMVGQFRRLLSGVSYLGPLRRPWSRVEMIHATGGFDGVGSTGEFAVNLLYRHPDLLSRVNRSLELLEMGYTLDIKTLGGDESTGVPDVVPPSLVPMLHHEQSDVWISPADAGFGLSQLLPLLVEMELRKQSIICIEQPELHLHPRLQANVGTILRKAVHGGNRNRFIIETHSEHLLLRLQRLISEGLLDASSVAVVYVDNQLFDDSAERFYQSISSTILTIRVGSTGELLDPWPGGFFDERWSEIRARRESRHGR